MKTTRSFLTLAIMTVTLAAAELERDPNELVKGYSTQRIIRLDVNETFGFKLKNGTDRVIRLVSVREYRDSVIHLMRRADIRVEIDGRPLDLVCGPYVMPTEIAGLRIQADTTTGWLPNMPKKVQFSLWDAKDPIVDTSRFGFPFRSYRLFSHWMQAFNEPLHNCAGDGDPAGLKGYHNYGFDMAGYEGGEEIVSFADGEVARFWPSSEKPRGVGIRDASGIMWWYLHVVLAPEVVTGARVQRGQRIATLGHEINLHVGREGNGRRLNLYPWLVTAYQAERPKSLLAVAQSHHTVSTGENERFDGSNSLAFGGRKIVEWRWVFHDGQMVRQPKAEKVFDKPGAYVATLWVKNDRGVEDVDFCQVKVFTRGNPEPTMPHIAMSSMPTENVQPNQTVRLRCKFQGKTTNRSLIQVVFDDGRVVDDYRSGTELTHRFQRVGLHIVTAQCEAEGKPITQKLKVVVEPAGASR